jgi:large subunit ribosomal protein L10
LTYHPSTQKEVGNLKRSEKEQAVGELGQRFKKAELTILTDYCGLTVAQMTDLRRSLREAKAELKVVKNTLAQRALQDTEMKVLSDYFKGTVAAVTSSGDPVSPAKALVKFAKDVEKFKVRVGFLSGKLISDKEIEALSKLPSREQMLASLLGSMNAPAQNLVNVFAAIPRKWVTVLAAVRDKKQS